ncbi:hypothetical protein GCM10022279_24470 [Comamonas faecalis]|uniref:Rrf2 family transcriptional regulator n=1 Tax=Comamonas faecalis TaxID=1387849 RepID=A0ABP7RN39_9BURK
MRLTTRSKLAVTALTDLALHSHGHPVALPAISTRQGIALSQLEEIFSALRRAEIVRSIRGPGGGYVLRQDAQTLSTADVITACERFLKRGNADAAQANAEQPDMTAELWSNFQTRVMDYLQSITIADLVAQHRRNHKHSAAAPTGKAAAANARAVVKPRARTQFPAQGVPNSVFALAGSAFGTKLRAS